MVKISSKELTKELTTDEIEELNALDGRTVHFDEDSPELTLEQIKQFRKMERNKQTVCIRLSPQTMKKAKALGKGYTSILSRMLDLALNDEELVKKCL